MRDDKLEVVSFGHWQSPHMVEEPITLSSGQCGHCGTVGEERKQFGKARQIHTAVIKLDSGPSNL